MSIMSIETSGKRLIDRRSMEWVANEKRWQWLLDSYEGGEIYRQATYGQGSRGTLLYNLIRHKREYPISRDGESASLPNMIGSDSSYRADEDDFQLRRAATPVPDWVHEAIEIHLAKVYGTEIKREGPKVLMDFWDDCDGCGSEMSDWISQDMGPLFLSMGQLDVVLDHPAIPDGEEIKTLLDEKRLKLNTVVASYILPQNMVWWDMDAKGNYRECLVHEPQPDGECLYRHWHAEGWTLYDDKGNITEEQAYDYGRPPIVSLMFRRSPRSQKVSFSRYERLADLQRCYYNRDSELILSDQTQAHPVLMAPEEYCVPDSTVPIGIGYILPKKKNNVGGDATYEPFEVLDFPKGAAESIRANMDRLRDAADRSACLTKPAGAAGTTGKTVAQSGVSKRLDSTTGNDLLAHLASVLAKAEHQIAEMVLMVSGVKQVPAEGEESISINYPGSFDLFSADELAMAIEQFQSMASSAGQCPELETHALQRYYREWMPGLDPEDYDDIDEEIEAFIESKKVQNDQTSEANVLMATAGAAAAEATAKEAGGKPPKPPGSQDPAQAA